MGNLVIESGLTLLILISLLGDDGKVISKADSG